MLRQWDGISPYQRGEVFDTIRIALSESGSDDDRRLIDRELAGWLTDRLAEPPETVDEVGWNSYVAALVEAFGLASSVSLPMTGSLLRDRHTEFKDWTRGLSEEGPGNIRARYLLALAHNQGETRRFLSLWLRLCRDAGADQPTPAEADFHLTIGLLGLRLLPSPDGGATVVEEAEGIIRWAARLPNTQEAHTRFLRRWRVFAEVFPRGSSDWAAMLENNLADHATRPFAAWLREELGIHTPTKVGPAREPARNDTFAVIDEIRKLPWGKAKAKIDQFMAKQERYAQSSGSAYTLSRAFNVLGNALLGMEDRPETPPLAERLAVKVLEHDANDEPSWVLWSKAMRRMGRVKAAEAVLWRACRFMLDKVHVRNVLAESMENEGRVAEAEALYRDTIKRFPADEVAPNALAKLLADNGRAKEAEALYRDTIKRFPTDEVAPSALAKLLADNGRAKEAEALYRDAIKRFPDDPVCRLDLGLLLLDLKRPLKEVQPFLEDLLRMRAPVAGILRRHMDAEQRGQRVPRQQNNQPKLTQSASPSSPMAEPDPDWSTFIASGDALHAEFLLSPALNDPKLLLVTAEKRADLRETAKTMLREAIARAPNNPVVRLIAARYPDVIARTIDADTARRVAGGDFGLRLELALRDKDEEALDYLFEDFHDPGQKAVAACGWLWLNSDSQAHGAEEAAEHLRHWLADDAPKTALPALVHIHDELRERLPFWSRNADRNGFLESWDSLHGDRQRRAQIRALIDIALLGLALAEMSMLADLPVAA
ncbi:tetratricopeptide (TPR) repeat protein [Azospirillum agricola]|uniref:tetratricopeptide repeat protein n=1 Tax=Azospirillum agricola TaxID=1720247 RepID=UPI001AE2349E|nr:tetratricopeptide repeat protein [Azospirillum agricola]MBP2226906.1 tetratricopeptide (TPR) repeat protein [Azospirillum agricola]